MFMLSRDVTWKAKATTAWSLINRTLDEYSRDRGELVAAALAFYALLSLAPLIIVAVAVAGVILDTGTARGEISQLLRETMGSGAASTVEGWVDEASESGGVASLVGLVLALMTASRLTVQLRSALNQIWNVDVTLVQGFKGNVKNYISRRGFALAMVLASGPLLLLIVASRAVLTGMSDVIFANAPLAGVLVGVTQFVFSIAVVTVLTALVFKVVPDTRVAWRPIWIGALLTSIAFNLGNLVVGIYLGRASVSATYGAAGSAIVVLLWTYFSAQVFLLGAEFTQVYSTQASPSPPEPNRELDVGAAGTARQT